MKQRYILALSALVLGFVVIVGSLGRPVGAQSGYYVSFSNATNTTGASIGTNDSKQIGYYVEFSSGVNAGEVVIETAVTGSYAGLWHELDRVAFGDMASVPSVYFGTYPGAPMLFVRARITTPVTGGTVNAYFTKMPNR